MIVIKVDESYNACKIYCTNNLVDNKDFAKAVYDWQIKNKAHFNLQQLASLAYTCVYYKTYTFVAELFSDSDACNDIVAAYIK